MIKLAALELLSDLLLTALRGRCNLELHDILTFSMTIFYVYFRTWDNHQLSDNMIRRLEEQGLAMAKQKQDYFGMI